MNQVDKLGKNVLHIKLTSNESLGILDSGYLEDYFGNDGQISVYCIEEDSYYPVVMTPVPQDTPSVVDDVFQGQLNINPLPLGHYEIRGRCRDIAGNYTAFNAIGTPNGQETIQSLVFEIVQTIKRKKVKIVGGRDNKKRNDRGFILEVKSREIGTLNRKHQTYLTSR